MDIIIVGLRAGDKLKGDLHKSRLGVAIYDGLYDTIWAPHNRAYLPTTVHCKQKQFLQNV